MIQERTPWRTARRTRPANCSPRGWTVIAGDDSDYVAAFARVTTEVISDTEATASLIFSLTGLAVAATGILAQQASDAATIADRARMNEVLRGCTAIVAQAMAGRGIVG